jgi:hypothetical protein
VIARTAMRASHAFDLIEAAATSFRTNADPDPDRKPTLGVVRAKLSRLSSQDHGNRAAHSV